MLDQTQPAIEFMKMALPQLISQARQHVRSHFEGTLDTAIILGSGLSELSVNGFNEVARIAYSDIDGLPQSTAPSHAGELRIISNGTKHVALCAGRHHLYEGYSAQQVSALTYLISALGASTLIVTNAAGALNPNYKPAQLMLINDHINFTGQNPLRGQDDSLGSRFPDMSQAYEPSFIRSAMAIAKTHDIICHEGIYAGVTGPSLETSAERRMLRTLGADAVGMSTVTEVIAAKHCGLKVLGISAITNLALGDKNQQVDTVEEVLKNAATAGADIKLILEALLANNGS